MVSPSCPPRSSSSCLSNPGRQPWPHLQSALKIHSFQISKFTLSILIPRVVWLVVIENTQSWPRLPDPRAVRVLYHNNCLKINLCIFYLYLISHSFHVNPQIGDYPPHWTGIITNRCRHWKRGGNYPKYQFHCCCLRKKNAVRVDLYSPLALDCSHEALWLLEKQLYIIQLFCATNQ